MTTAFFNNSEDVIERKIHISSLHKNDLDSSDIESVFDLSRCSSWVNTGKYKKVGLQFPDELLRYSAAILSNIIKSTEAQCFILADTSYGSCCVDEVAAQHYEADSIIHFGHACLSPTRRLPVLYIYGHHHISVSECCAKFQQLIPELETKVLMLIDVEYLHSKDLIVHQLQSNYINIVVQELQECSQRSPSECNTSSNTEHVKYSVISYQGRSFKLAEGLKLEDYTVFYIGEENMLLSNLVMSWNKCTIMSYIPSIETARTEKGNVNKLLMKRFYMVERAKDANIVGILVGTLGVEDYLTMLNHLKHIIQLSGKKSYVFSVGKINVAKLANFSEIDIYVLISCPENSLLDSSEFYRPVVTPYEMELACNPDRQWTGEYSLDFRQLLPDGDCHVPMPETINRTDVSLVTGGMRQFGLQEANCASFDTLQSSIAKKDDWSVISSGSRLNERTWQGLQPDLGQTPITKAVDGQSGIAMEYTHEPNGS